MNITFPALTGRSVQLEPFTEEHREGLRLAADDDRVWEYLTVLGRGAEFDRWFDEALVQRELGKRVPFAVRLLSTGELVGATGYIDPMPLHKRVEIGWTWYRPDQWSTAVNPECKLLLLTHAFDVIGVNRVQFFTDLLNTRSQAAIAKLGAVREGVLRSYAITRGGRVRDSVVFAIIAPEWPRVKDRLSRRVAVLIGKNS